MFQRTAIHILCVSLFLAMAPATSAVASNPYSGMSARAQAIAESVVSMLETSGYDILRIEKTWLRRLRILADNGKHTREIVVSRSTGQIKSDMIVAMAIGARSGDDDNDNNAGKILIPEDTASNKDDNDDDSKGSKKKDGDDGAGKGKDDGDDKDDKDEEDGGDDKDDDKDDD